MSLARKGEIALVKEIRKKFSSRLGKGFTGIGDDAAVIPAQKGKYLLATVDALVEGVHFDLSFITPRQLGYKLIAVNASDIYAMCGSPTYAFLSMAMPSNTKLSFVDSFLEGIEDGIKKHKTVLAGGDVSSSPSGISLSATILGYAERPVRRSGAKPDHSIFVTGTIGDSACGLEILKRIGRHVDIERGRQSPLPWKLMGPLISRHLAPEPVGLSKSMAVGVSAMMDLSDGLLLDLSRLCEESGVGAELYEEALPTSREMRAVAERLGLDPLGLALSGGEDYMLLFTSPRRHVRGAHRIGKVVSDIKVFHMLDSMGRRRKLSPEGYGHFGQSGK